MLKKLNPFLKIVVMVIFFTLFATPIFAQKINTSNNSQFQKIDFFEPLNQINQLSQITKNDADTQLLTETSEAIEIIKTPSSQSETFSDYRKTFAHHDFFIGYGYPYSGLTFVLFLLPQVITTIGSLGDTTLKVQGAGTFQFGYNYFVLDWLGLGVMGTCELFDLNFKDNTGKGNSHIDHGFFGSIQGKVTFMYGGKYIRNYHSASLGVLFIVMNNEPSASFAFNLTLEGIRFGPKDGGLNGFIELGWGNTSLLNAGLIYSF